MRASAEEARLVARARAIVFVATAVAAAFALAGSAQAGIGVWGPSHGPAEADVNMLAVDPTNPATVYAGTNGGGVVALELRPPAPARRAL